MTTLTTLTTEHTPVDGFETVSTPTRVLLIGAPLVMAVGRVLLVPFDDQNWQGTLTSMAAHRARSDTGWLLALFSTGLLAATAVLLARRAAAAGRTRAAWFATVTTVIGWACTAAVCSGGLVMAQLAKAPDRAVQVQILKDFNDGTSTFVMFLMTILAGVGYIVLAVSLARARVVTKGAAVLVCLGAVTTLVTMAGPVTVLLVLTALLLATGHALTCRTPSPE